MISVHASIISGMNKKCNNIEFIIYYTQQVNTKSFTEEIINW